MTSRSGALGGVLAVGALVLTAVLYNAFPVRGSDHQDSPTTVARPAADITDVFVYPDPNDATRVVFQMDVYPLLVPGNTSAAALDPAVLYQFKIAHGAAGNPEDAVIQFRANAVGPAQTIAVSGPVAPTAAGTNSTFVASGAQNISFNTASTIANGVQVFVGPRADPFAFDLVQFFKIIPDRSGPSGANAAPSASGFRGFTAAFNSAHGTNCDTSPASDFLSAGSYNVIALVFEAPKSLIAPASGSQTIHVWATTSTTTGS